MTDTSYTTLSALEDFRRARRRAAIEIVLARLQGKSPDLLQYEEVRRRLHAANSHISRGVQDIPLEKIVGSVGRSTDFTRSFLPLNRDDEARWTRVQSATSSLDGLPPIEVYQLGDAYFVLDGNHRVSVARQAGASHIQAHVYEVTTPVSLESTDQPTDIIVKGEYAEFLVQTGLASVRPAADLRMTVPGQYRKLLTHIAAHGAALHPDRPDLLDPATVGDWYDNVYLPVIEVIREQGLLREFPGRTETDLYVWILEHRTALESTVGWSIRLPSAASDFVAQRSPHLGRTLRRMHSRIAEMVMPDVLVDGPPPGRWRAEQQGDRLFADILLPLSGDAQSWTALEQAILIAKREDGTIHGLHVVPPGSSTADNRIEAMQTEFARRCAAAGVQGHLSIDTGRVADRIAMRARWTDFVVVHLEHPPAAQPLARLRSGFRTLVRRSARPILAVPHLSQLERAIVAYDGSAKANEALFAATYLARHCRMELVVITVLEYGQTSDDTLSQAQAYLERHAVQATYAAARGPIADAIVETGTAHHCDMVIVGGYGLRPVAEAVLGSTVDQLLRTRWQPILICR